MAGPRPDWAAHVERLPARWTALLEEWQLTPDGPRGHGHGSLVGPVRTSGGEPARLKLGVPDVATAQEHLALRHWHGHGAARLLRADPRRDALLLERLDARDLTTLPDLEACEVVADLYGRLHVAAPPSIRSLGWYVARWAAALGDLARDAPIPRRLVEQALSLVPDLLADDPGRLLHGDLHGANVLAATRAPWLAIDPQPTSGDPHWEPAPMLWNRWDELGDDVRTGVRRRFHTLVDGAALDEDRARGWVVVRMVVNALRTVLDAERAGRPPRADERAWITRCVTLAKAVQD